MQILEVQRGIADQALMCESVRNKVSHPPALLRMRKKPARLGQRLCVENNITRSKTLSQGHRVAGRPGLAVMQPGDVLVRAEARKRLVHIRAVKGSSRKREYSVVAASGLNMFSRLSTL